ncbi:MAG TPA: hypothetical protein VNM91_09810, partial [Dehalococcoidia bacterium]|nr:hypothetical protein [Dehalococcoidia bacterium]
MLFPAEIVPAIERGAVTVAFRRWSRPRARAGSMHRLTPGSAIQIVSVDRVGAGAVTSADARRAGYAGRAALLEDMQRHGGPLARGELVYRVELRCVRQRDPRAVLAAHATLGDEERHALRQRLHAMTERNTRGVSFEELLRLVAAHPRVPASRLAAKVRRPVPAFKADVR